MRRQEFTWKMTEFVTVEQVAALLRRAQLDPDQWNPPEITRKANTWIADNLGELSHMSVDWTPEDRAAHLSEFGHLSAVDFIEQCVIEVAPDTAPWQDLQHRADAGEFEGWPPVWTAHSAPHPTSGRTLS